LKKRLAFWLTVAGATGAAVLFAPPSEESAAPEVALAAPAPARAPAAADTAPALPERQTLGRPRGEAFAARSWAPPAPKPAAAPAAVAVAAPPAPPPMPYRVAGRVSRGGESQVLLARGDAVLPVRVGDTLDGGYRVEAIEPERVTLLYVALDVRHNLPVVSTLGPSVASSVAGAKPEAAAPAARLRWEGPREVRAGSPFDVVLKVTSAQPLRASPLQLVFDAKLLEPVEVRPGGFFAGGMFSYRVNPAGSIFVGAAGKGAVAADAELLVVTFRPIQPGATAELKLSSVMLQNAAGSAIALDRPAAFRTAILQ
jgi:hypothetical protein